MLSLQQPTHHVSSYGTSASNHPTVQSSYDYTLNLCNSTTWGAVAPYPSPPMSSSPSATAHFSDRAFDPYAARMRPQAHDMFWPQHGAAYPQAMYPQIPQQPQHHHHQMALPSHGRSPRLVPQTQAFLPPLPVAEPYPTFQQSAIARSYAPSNGSYYPSVAPITHGQPVVPMSSIPAKTVPPKTVRRTKTHVQNACFNCKKAHLSCDVGRPCNRCKQSGKQDTCYNVAHRRRGRPRLRDSFGNKIIRNNDSQNQPGLPASTSSAKRRSSDPLRVLKSNGEQTTSFTGHSAPPSAISNSTSPNFGFPQSGFSAGYSNLPVAFLDLDLNIVQMNHIFRTVFGLGYNIQGGNFDLFLDDNDKHKLHVIRSGLRHEKETRDPLQLNPIRMPGTGDADKIPLVETSDISALVNQNYQERSETVRIRVAGGIMHQIRVTIRLARAERAGVFFAVLTLPYVPEPGPTYAPQQPEPPRLMTASNSSYAYTDTFPMSANSYGGSTSFTGTQRGSAATSGPPSPAFNNNYTFTVPQPAQLAQTRSSYDQPNYYMTQYTYPTDGSVTAPAMAGASEPRQFPSYQQDPTPIQMHFAQPQSATQQQLMQPNDYQLPSVGVNAAESRPRTAADTQMNIMRQDAYGRSDQQHSYMHDVSQHGDPSQANQDTQMPGRRVDVQALLGR